MKKIHCIFAGSISYGLIQIANILYSFLSGRFNEFDPNFGIKELAGFAVFSIPGVCLIGAVIGFIFYWGRDWIPHPNMYLKSIAFHVCALLLLSAKKGPEFFLSFDFIFSVIVTVPAAALFAWLCIKFSNSKNILAVAGQCVDI